MSKDSKATPGIGELARKEFLSWLSCPADPTIATGAASVLPFGQGARNGALAFLGLTENFHEEVEALLGSLSDIYIRGKR